MDAKRRIVMFNWMTADGFFTSPDGALDWVVPDEEQSKAAVKNLPGSDTMLLGRRTFEMFEKFWRPIGEGSAQPTDPHGPGANFKENVAIAKWMTESTKLVFSRTLKSATWTNTRIIREFDPREIETMKAASGKDMMIFGSGTIVSQLTQHGLIDEYQFAVCPVVLGKGRTLLSDVSKRAKLELKEAKPLPSGDVILRYARKSAS